MSKIYLMAVDELGDDFCICRCEMLESGNISREQKSSFARFLINEKSEQYPEARNLHFEKEYSYINEEELYDYYYNSAKDEGYEGDELDEIVEQWFDETIEEHYDLGFDY